MAWVRHLERPGDAKRWGDCSHGRVVAAPLEVPRAPPLFSLTLQPFRKSGRRKLEGGWRKC